MSEAVTMEQLAREIGVGYWRIRYAHRTGKLPEPKRVAGARVYDAEQAQRVREHFATETAKARARLNAVRV
jgi:hypothetical protein